MCLIENVAEMLQKLKRRITVKALHEKIENLFVELGFRRVSAGERQSQYLYYNDLYCKVTYLPDWEAFVIETADDIKYAEGGALEDSGIYYLKDYADVPEEIFLEEIRNDIIKYYM